MPLFCGIEPPPPDIAGTVAMLREFSRQTDPHLLVNTFRDRQPAKEEGEYWLSLSRRDLERPWYRITRHTQWPEDHDPWKVRDRLPLYDRGLLGSLIYSDGPAIVNDVPGALGDDDPGRPHLEGVGSLVALPQFDKGTSLNMIVRVSRQRDFFSWARMTDFLTFANVLGKAVSNLVLSKKLERAYADLDYQFAVVGKIQQSLLPASVPHMPGLDIATSYRTATRAGGDYYDFFRLDAHRFAMIVADVGGHGPIAAVVMAMLRTLLHSGEADHDHPARVLAFLNRKLLESGQGNGFRFATAFHGVYDATDRSLRYASAGHCPPMLRRPSGEVIELDHAQSLPIGVQLDASFAEALVEVRPGDGLLIYTDGVSESSSPTGEMFGTARIRSLLADRVPKDAGTLLGELEGALAHHTHSAPLEDDVTLVFIKC